MSVYCFDFDGVICDSARELAYSAWLAAADMWPNLCTGEATEGFIEKFCRYRPVIEVGYQSILLTRMIHEAMPEAQILGNFEAMAKMLMEVLDIKQEALIETFAATRDRQLQENSRAWLGLHRFYDGMPATINDLIARKQTVCIITTKQQRYARALATMAGLNVPPKLVFGLEAGKKLLILKKLVKHPQLHTQNFYFFEDRLPTLQATADDAALNNVQLLYCTWGYTTEAERADAEGCNRITPLTLAECRQQFGSSE